MNTYARSAAIGAAVAIFALAYLSLLSAVDLYPALIAPPEIKWWGGKPAELNYLDDKFYAFFMMRDLCDSGCDWAVRGAAFAVFAKLSFKQFAGRFKMPPLWHLISCAFQEFSKWLWRYTKIGRIGAVIVFTGQIVGVCIGERTVAVFVSLPWWLFFESILAFALCRMGFKLAFRIILYLPVTPVRFTRLLIERMAVGLTDAIIDAMFFCLWTGVMIPLVM